VAAAKNFRGADSGEKLTFYFVEILQLPNPNYFNMFTK
jgi:hypothetical protein